MGALAQSRSLTSGVASNQIALAYSGNCTPGSQLVAVCAWQSATATCALADPSNGAWTPVGAPVVGSGTLAGFSSQAFLLGGNGSGAALTVTATVQVSVTNRLLAIHEYTGVSGLQSHLEQLVTGSAAPAAPVRTPASSSDIVFTWIICGGSESALTGGYTIREKANFGNNGTADIIAPTGGTPTSGNWTTSTTDNAVGTLVFSAVGAGVPSGRSLDGVGV